jgi:hypothetical protein
MAFPIKLFTRKGNLVFMNNLYHKFGAACVCTALGFALGANKEAKAATFTLIPTYPSVFIAVDFGGSDGLGDAYYPTSTPSVAIRPDIEIRAFYEFNIGNLSLATNTIIRQAIVETRINSSNTTNFPNFLSIFGYVGNGIPDISDFEAGVFLNSVDISSSSANDILRFDVTPFVNQLVSNNDNFAGFGIRASNFGGVGLNATNNNSSLVVETDDVAEPVPEPTTIFGSALALGVGGLLKRKKSSQQNKTRSQH